MRTCTAHLVRAVVDVVHGPDDVAYRLDYP